MDGCHQPQEDVYPWSAPLPAFNRKGSEQLIATVDVILSFTVGVSGSDSLSAFKHHARLDSDAGGPGLMQP